MDPFSGLAAAETLLKFIKVGSDSIKSLKELYTDGSTRNNAVIEASARSLTEILPSLERTNTNDTSKSDDEKLSLAGTLPASYGIETEAVEDLRLKFHETGRQLLEELSALKRRQGKSKVLSTILAAARNAKRKSHVLQLEKKLRNYQRDMSTGLLSKLANNVDWQAPQITIQIQALGEDQRKLVDALACGQTDVSSILVLMEAEHQKTRDLIISSRTEDQIDREIDEVLKSLFFVEMYARHEHITEAHKQTFRWIFEEPGTRSSDPFREWSNFSEWLSDKDQHIYWVYGKPASGKSTLMDFVCGDNRTKDLLKACYGEQEAVFLQHWFWKPGTDLQKNMVGFLRSMVYQHFTQNRHLHKEVQQSSIAKLSVPTKMFGTIAEWTEKRLKAAFRALVDNCDRPTFILLDGLDEFEGSQEQTVDLLSLLLELSGKPNIKLCVSSRDEIAIRNRLEHFPRLRLQDLTKPDIAAYVSARLEPVLPERQDLSFLRDAIAERAQGVFLWVRLTIDSLLEGIETGDDAVDIRRRLDETPEELDDFYQRIMSSLQPLYREQAAMLFSLTDRCLDYNSFFTLFFMVKGDGAGHLLLGSDLHDTDELIEKARVWLSKYLKARSRSLIETVPQKTPVTHDHIPGHPRSFKCLSASSQEFMNTPTTFLHRTARDFIFSGTQNALKPAAEFTTDCEIYRGIYRYYRFVRQFLSQRSQGIEPINWTSIGHEEELRSIVWASKRMLLWASDAETNDQDFVNSMLDTLSREGVVEPRPPGPFEALDVHRKAMNDLARKTELQMGSDLWGRIHFWALAARYGVREWVLKQLEDPENTLKPRNAQDAKQRPLSEHWSRAILQEALIIQLHTCSYEGLLGDNTHDMTHGNQTIMRRYFGFLRGLALDIGINAQIAGSTPWGLILQGLEDEVWPKAHLMAGQMAGLHMSPEVDEADAARKPTFDHVFDFIVDLLRQGADPGICLQRTISIEVNVDRDSCSACRVELESGQLVDEYFSETWTFTYDVPCHWMLRIFDQHPNYSMLLGLLQTELADPRVRSVVCLNSNGKRAGTTIPQDDRFLKPYWPRFFGNEQWLTRSTDGVGNITADVHHELAGLLSELQSQILHQIPADRTSVAEVPQRPAPVEVS